jgi:phage terminase large subunit
LIEAEIKARKQFKEFLSTDKRWSIAVAHRRAGKTVACVQKLTKAALECKLNEPRFAYVAPLFNQAKDIAWLYLRHYARLLGAGINESELRVDFPGGARIRLYGADNPDRLRGMYLDGVVLDEYADMRPSVWGEIIRPMLADRRGWATFIGTPKGRNEFFELWEHAASDPSWYRTMLRASETGLLNTDELLDAKRTMTPEQYEQEFECSFEAAILGAYFGKEIAQAERDGRITAVDYDPAIPVHTAWDLGIGDSTAIWFWQMAGDEIRVIDHYEAHSQALPHYAAVLASKPYKYGTDWVPHDAKVRSLETGRTRIETLIGLKRFPRLVPNHNFDDGVNAARVTLPRVWFDRDRCRDGIEALRQYRTEFDEKTKAFKNSARHDWTSHTADAFRYLCMAWRSIAIPEKKEPPPMRGAENMTVDELLRETRPVRLRV